MRNIVIVGGGTAGWLSAMYIKKKYPLYNITLIESTDIGILGAGEGGTPNLRSIIVDDFGLDENEFLKSVNGTKKYGIIFDKWNVDSGHSFIHGFSPDGLENETYSYHFDARLFAQYLKTKAIELGVIHMDNEISDFELDNEFVTKILLKDGSNILVDFLIDCSGFSRLVIGKLFDTKWNSYEDELLINSAIPFFIHKSNKDLNQRTIAEAAEDGWYWQIPLQNRWGCGYLFNDTLIDDESIILKIKKKFFEDEITINKKIKFKPGCFDKVWISNCVAVGLSTGFLEPLEATSIMTTIFQLRRLPTDLFDYAHREQYNYNVKQYNYQNMLFIRHHYNCSRNDSEFWKIYRSKAVPNDLQRIYNKLTGPNILDTFNVDEKTLTFSVGNYKHIMINNFIKTQNTLL
jgi:tryptophan halogenase